MSNTAEVVVIGGGAIGLSAAYHAAGAGADVLLVERDEVGRGCSYGNAGLIVPSFSLPLASPSTLRDLPQLLLGTDLRVRFKLRADLDLYRWILRFLLASRHARMVATARQLGRLGQESLRSFKEWSTSASDFGFRQRGWLHLYGTPGGLHLGLQEAEFLGQMGVSFEALSVRELQGEELGLADDYLGGILFPDEAQLEPFTFCRWLADEARGRGVRMLEGVEAQSLRTVDGRLSHLETTGGGISADHFVVTTGVWSGALVEDLIGWLPVEPGLGYSVTFDSLRAVPTRPLMFAEKHIVVTPMGGQLRATSGLDLLGLEAGPAPESIDWLRTETARALSAVQADSSSETWHSYRPMTPDGLPLIGPCERFPNLLLATGHGQLGMTLAPITGQIVACQLTGIDPPVDPSSLSPSRFGL